MRSFVLAVLFLSAASCLVSAQTAAAITGEVTDQSGAAAPTATVVATNTATGVARTTSTNNSGVYSFPDLTPGTRKQEKQKKK